MCIIKCHYHKTERFIETDVFPIFFPWGSWSDGALRLSAYLPACKVTQLQTQASVGRSEAQETTGRGHRRMKPTEPERGELGR